MLRDRKKKDFVIILYFVISSREGCQEKKNFETNEFREREGDRFRSDRPSPTPPAKRARPSVATVAAPTADLKTSNTRFIKKRLRKSRSTADSFR